MSPPSASGQRILAMTGAAFTVLTVAGGLCQWLWPLALWARLFFSIAISGLVGFATNWVAIKMLFHPRVRIFGVQGVVPSRRRELARSVGKTLEQHLISGDRMHKLLVSTGAVDAALSRVTGHLPRLLEEPATRELVTREIAGTIQSTMADVVDAAKEKMREKARSNFTALVTGAAATASFGPMAGIIAAGVLKSGLFDKLVGKMIDDLADDLRKDGGIQRASDKVVAQLPGRAEAVLADPGMRARLMEQVDSLTQELLQAVDVAGLVEGELLGRDDSELEELIDRVASSELVFIQVAGGLLGMVAGLALVWPWLLIPIAGLFLVMVQVARVAERRYTAGQAPKPHPPAPVLPQPPAADSPGAAPAPAPAAEPPVAPAEPTVVATEPALPAPGQAAG
ncbi:MAG: DUF445 family protein [Planctomycetes bacterium]|nr:DUF445 family protein [Planctomycetota bacterium]